MLPHPPPPAPVPPPESADDRFANTALSALRSTQSNLADVPGKHILRYRPEVCPFVCLLGDAEAGLTELAARMLPGELEWVLHPTAEPLLPNAAAWAEAHRVRLSGFGGVSQMVFPADAPIPESPDSKSEDEIVPLLGPDAGQEMVDLTTVAFPGFFRIRTNAMGPYFGIRREGRLIAMGGDRMCFGEFREVSGICTLPEYRGQGLASAIIRRILREHRAAGFRSYLHLATANTGARRIYDQLGFVFTRELFCSRVFKPLDQRQAPFDAN